MKQFIRYTIIIQVSKMLSENCLIILFFTLLTWTTMMFTSFAFRRDLGENTSLTFRDSFALYFLHFYDNIRETVYNRIIQRIEKFHLNWQAWKIDTFICAIFPFVCILRHPWHHTSSTVFSPLADLFHSFLLLPLIWKSWLNVTYTLGKGLRGKTWMED